MPAARHYEHVSYTELWTKKQDSTFYIMPFAKTTTKFSEMESVETVDSGATTLPFLSLYPVTVDNNSGKNLRRALWVVPITYRWFTAFSILGGIPLHVAPFILPAPLSPSCKLFARFITELNKPPVLKNPWNWGLLQGPWHMWFWWVCHILLSLENSFLNWLRLWAWLDSKSSSPLLHLIHITRSKGLRVSEQDL